MGFTCSCTDQEKKVYSLLILMISWEVNLVMFVSVSFTRWKVSRFERSNFSTFKPANDLLLRFLHNLCVHVQRFVNICIRMFVTHKPGFASIVIRHDTARDGFLCQFKIQVVVTI